MFYFIQFAQGTEKSIRTQSVQLMWLVLIFAWNLYLLLQLFDLNFNTAILHTAKIYNVDLQAKVSTLTSEKNIEET